MDICIKMKKLNKKLNRNEKILLSELKANPNNPYICYQLAMNYSAFGEKRSS